MWGGCFVILTSEELVVILLPVYPVSPRIKCTILGWRLYHHCSYQLNGAARIFSLLPYVPGEFTLNQRTTPWICFRPQGPRSLLEFCMTDSMTDSHCFPTTSPCSLWLITARGEQQTLVSLHFPKIWWFIGVHSSIMTSKTTESEKELVLLERRWIWPGNLDC